MLQEDGVLVRKGKYSNKSYETKDSKLVSVGLYNTQNFVSTPKVESWMNKEFIVSFLFKIPNEYLWLYFNDIGQMGFVFLLLYI